MPCAARLILDLFAVVLAVAIAAPAANAALDDPVESGRDALIPRGDFPWYDGQSDDVRPIKLRNPAAEEQSREPVASVDTQGAEVVAWIIIGVVVAGLLGLLIYAAVNSERSDARDRGKQADTAEIDLAALPVPIAAAQSDLLALARHCYEQGEFGRAMIYLYSHLLVRLDQARLIRLARGKTNRQYLREIGGGVAGRGSLAAYFERAIDTFESAFFGRRELARDEFESAWRGVDDFQRLIDEAHA